jgi:hypothetical protein
MAYTPTVWQQGVAPFINATHLNNMEQGIVGAYNLIPAAGKGGFGGVLVASNDAPSIVKSAADYVCDGLNDQAEINAALVDAAVIPGQGGPAGGTWRGGVLLSGGRFFLGGSALMQNATSLRGQGKATVLMPVGLSAVTGAGANPAVIKLADTAAHLCEVANLHINMNAAAGGAGHGINFDMTAGAATSGLPDMNPDSDHSIINVSMNNAQNAARHGIWFLQDTGSHNRGNMIYGCQIRLMGGNGIRAENASDMLISNNHMGGSSDYGYYISGGNTMLNGNKSYFSDTGGYLVSSGRAMLVGCSSQDELVGFTVNGANSLLSGCMADTSQNALFQIGANGIVMAGCYGFVRGGGRYATATRGLYFPSAVVGCKIDMGIDPTNVTTPFSGSFVNNRGQVVNTDTGALFASG